MLLKSLGCDCEVNEGHLDADLGWIVRVGHLGCHEESEASSILDWLIGSKLDLLGSIVAHELLMEQDWVNTWIDMLIHIFE